MNRRYFLQFSAIAAASSLVEWKFAGAVPKQTPEGEYDAVVVGAGLGGLTCAAYLSKNGFKTILLEQYDVPGGYATSFTRLSENGDFTCEVSLHSSVLGAGHSRQLLTELGVFDKLELVEHPHAWCSRFPDFPIDVPAKCGLAGFERQLAGLFPNEAKGLADYFTLWRGVMTEAKALEKGLSDSEKFQFKTVFPNLWYIQDKTVGQLVDAHVCDPKAKAVLTQSCGYYGLPPSQLAAFYYLRPTGEYLELGGSYVKGTSQALSDALAKAITDAGGKIVFGATVESILMDNGRATGVKTHDGRSFTGRAVICNASGPQVFGKLLPGGSLPKPEHAKLKTYTYSPSSFVVWLGLNKDITKQFPYPEVSYYGSFDSEANYKNAMDCDFDKAGFALMVYDNLVPGFSPQGCTSISIETLCGYKMWQEMEKDYLADRKDRYNKKKEQLTNELIALTEKRAIPGLSKMIIMSDSATPLTNFRFTLNTAGALYGYNQSKDNSFMTRLSNKTGVPGLYLASAWGNPGGGYGGALLGGKSAFKDVMAELSPPA